MTFAKQNKRLIISRNVVDIQIIDYYCNTTVVLI